MPPRPVPLWIFALLGALAALAQAPLSQPLALVVGAGGLLWAGARPGTPRRAAWAGWLAGAGYFAVALHWIVEPFLVDIATHGWLAPFGLIGLAGGLALFWAAAFWATARLRGGALTLAALLALAETLRAHILTGFPWADLAQGLMDTPMAHLLPWVGPRGVALIALMALGGLAASLRPRGLALALIGLGGVLSLAPGPGPGPVAAGAPVIRLVQPNAPQDEKWDPRYLMTFFDRQVAFTSEGTPPDLIVWPEMSLPWDVARAGDALTIVSEAARGAPVVLGLPRFEGDAYYNSALVLGRGGRQLAGYDKGHLVPFGEYMPFPRLTNALGLRGLAATIGAYSSGPGPALISLPGIGRARPLICYEGIFAEEVRRPAERPRLLLMMTNDAWFGTFAGPYQHLIQARMRALELGLPMVRVANTGISAVIDAHGSVTGAIPLGEAGWVDLPLPEAQSLTIYAIWGEIPALVGLIGGLLGVFWRRRRGSD